LSEVPEAVVVISSKSPIDPGFVYPDTETYNSNVLVVPLVLRVEIVFELSAEKVPPAPPSVAVELI
jgi:hypothetical protein